MLTIPAYWVTILASLYAIEYFGRVLTLRPISYFWIAKVISGVYLAAVYMAYFLGNVPSDVRHILGRYGIVGFVGVLVLDIIVKHILGIESWIHTLIHRGKHGRKYNRINL